MIQQSIDEVDALMTNEVFADLSVEQLLYAALKGVSGDVAEVQSVLSSTDWSQWLEVV